jgi:hypothetical protein
MEKCKICGEHDEDRLTICSRFVNGEVKHTVLCFSCFLIDRFGNLAEANGDGKEKLRHKEKVCGVREGDSQQNGTFLLSERHPHEIFCNKDNRERAETI